MNTNTLSICINNLIYADDTTLMVEREEELKSLLMRVKEESAKADLNSTFKKLRSWHVVPSLQSKCMGKKVEALTDFIFLGSKITVDCDWSHENKTLDPWKESFDKPRQHIINKKQRHHYADKGPSSQFFQ